MFWKARRFHEIYSLLKTKPFTQIELVQISGTHGRKRETETVLAYHKGAAPAIRLLKVAVNSKEQANIVFKLTENKNSKIVSKRRKKEN